MTDQQLKGQDVKAHSNQMNCNCRSSYHDKSADYMAIDAYADHSNARTGFLPSLHPPTPTRAPGTAQPSQDMDNVSLAHLVTVLPRRTRQPLNSSNTSTAIVESQKRRTKRSQSKGRPSIIDLEDPAGSPTSLFSPPPLSRPSETQVLRVAA